MVVRMKMMEPATVPMRVNVTGSCLAYDPGGADGSE